MVKVKLFQHERKQAFQWAKQVAKVCIDNNRTYTSYNKKVSPERIYLGYLGEIAVAKAFNFKHNLQIFSGPEQLDNKANQLPDINDDIEVRTIDKSYLKLIVRPHDLDKYKFVLTYYSKNTQWCHLLGFVKGHDAKQKKYYSEGHHGLPAYYVPQSDLKPIFDLVPYV